MFYFLLICSIFILVCSLFSITRTIRNINKQIKEKRKIRVSLSNRDIEELAYAINQKDALHKKLQVQIKQEEEQLKQSISNISHDLRTPLTSIQGYLTLLQECEDKQEQDQYIKIIKAKTDYLTDLVQEFYDLSVVENEQFDVECETVDINRVVTDCLIEKYYEFGEIQPIIQTEKSPVWIYGNNLVCKRIIENLITNAIRYADNYIEVSITHEGVFKIKNSTQSLDDIDMKLLFSKFYTADKSRTKGGSGLGLYIVKELLEKINGKIENVCYKENILLIEIQFSLYNTSDF
ncbi:sensor histidine kinase [[Ruminococcus] torques]|uniref:sensor histidine kinase n=1 Tax=[Ruminococcus] torques TaxID=33039 RepID=UPI002432F394|nr:HAMP domain-containing sensor histidine kinase [[Ruminococcus] torques]